MADPAQRHAARPRGALRGRIALAVDKARDSDFAKSAGLAGAMIVGNVIALGATVAFGRLLGVRGYGSLAALLSAFMIVSVPGAALQVAAAREGALGRLGKGGDLAATLMRWIRRLGAATLVVTAASILARHQLAAAIGIEDDASWAAAAVPPAACLWLLLSIERGLLQGLRGYGAVGVSLIAEQGSRLVLGVGLAAAGLDVTGAFLGTPLAFVVLVAGLAWLLHRRLGPERSAAPLHRLRELVRGGWAPIAGLAILAVLQNIDVIVAKHKLTAHTAGSYAAAAVAAKVVIWVAMGAGFYLVPEVARHHANEEDPRSVLVRAIAIIVVAALPCLLLFAFAPELILRLGFGAKYVDGASALIVLAGAMSLLAIAYLAVQYQLALHRWRFLLLLGVIAVLEPLVLVLYGSDSSPVEFATIVLAVQAVVAVLVLGACVRRPRPLARE